MPAADSRPIATTRGYRAALRLLAELRAAPYEVRDLGRIRVLARAVDAYEHERFRLDDADPIEVLRAVLQARGLRQRDLAPWIGSPADVLAIMRRRKALTLGMVQRLSMGLGVPGDVLLRRYAVTPAAPGRD